MQAFEHDRIDVAIEHAHLFVGADKHAFICKVVEPETVVGIFFKHKARSCLRYIDFFGFESLGYEEP